MLGLQQCTCTCWSYIDIDILSCSRHSACGSRQSGSDHTFSVCHAVTPNSPMVTAHASRIGNRQLLYTMLHNLHRLANTLFSTTRALVICHFCTVWDSFHPHLHGKQHAMMQQRPAQVYACLLNRTKSKVPPSVPVTCYLCSPVFRHYCWALMSLG